MNGPRTIHIALVLPHRNPMALGPMIKDFSTMLLWRFGPDYYVTRLATRTLLATWFSAIRPVLVMMSKIPGAV